MMTVKEVRAILPVDLSIQLATGQVETIVKRGEGDRQKITDFAVELAQAQQGITRKEAV